MSTGKENVLVTPPGIHTGSRRIAPIRPATLNAAPNIPRELTPEWIHSTVNRAMYLLDRLATAGYDYSREFDQYQPNSSATESGTLIELQASYEQIERVESIIVTGPVGATTASELSNEGQAATPAGGTVLAQVTVPAAGLYQIAWSVAVQTAAATLADNVRLAFFLGNTIEQAIQPVAINAYPQLTVGPIYIPANTTIVVAVSNTEATATLAGELTVTPYNGNVPFTLQLGSRFWNLALPPTGVLVISPVAIRLDNSDIRQITSAVNADWNLELMGHADINYRRP